MFSDIIIEFIKTWRISFFFFLENNEPTTTWADKIAAQASAEEIFSTLASKDKISHHTYLLFRFYESPLTSY